jgi:LysM repeat protein
MTMSRRDTIILAVLINASLLSILFFTATRPESSPTPSLATSRIVDNTTLVLPNLNSGSGFVATLSEPSERYQPSVRYYAASIDDRPEQVEPQQQIYHSDNFVSATPAVRPEAPIHSEPKPQEEYVEVMVKRGDFLEKIARSNGTTVTEVKRINNLANDRIDIGQVLLVPATKRAAPTQGAQVSTAQPKQEMSGDSVEFYVIKSGDNPWTIARQYHLKLDDLLRLNNLDEDKARNLKPGDKIRVR